MAYLVFIDLSMIMRPSKSTKTCCRSLKLKTCIGQVTYADGYILEHVVVDCGFEVWHINQLLDLTMILIILSFALVTPYSYVVHSIKCLQV